MKVATTQARCPFCGTGNEQFRLVAPPDVRATAMQVTVECRACLETFRVVWRGRHADFELLRHAYPAGLPVSLLQQAARWRDMVLAALREERERDR